MKIRFGLMLAILVSVDAMAQTATNGVSPAGGKTVPAAKPEKKPAPAPSEGKPIVPLPLNTPVLVSERVVVVRGKPDINGETIGHLKRGDTVTVLEEVTIHPGQDEPARWAKIALPEGIHVWVNRLYVDTNGAVLPAKLNVRTGPGENYSVAGLLHRGDPIKELSTKGDWREIEAPPGMFAFVAAHLLKPKPEPVKPVEFVAVPVAAPKPVIGEPAHPTVVPVESKPVVSVPTPKTAVAEPVKPVPAPVIPPPVHAVEIPKPSTTETPQTPPVIVPPVTNPPPAVVTPPAPVVETAKPTPPPVEVPVPVATPVVTNEVPALPEATTPAPEAPAEKRIVTREGIVRGTVSIQAPTHYQLQSLDNGKIINYLYSTKTNVSWKKMKGRTVIVTGEEGLDERWPNTPVIMVDKVQVVQ